MVFVAEYISKEDLEKYNVVNIVNKYRIKYRCRTPLSDIAIEHSLIGSSIGREIFGLCSFAIHAYQIHEMDLRARRFIFYVIRAMLSSLI